MHYVLFVLLFKKPPRKLGFTTGIMINNYKYLMLFLLSIAIIIPFRELFSHLIYKAGFSSILFYSPGSMASKELFSAGSK